MWSTLPKEYPHLFFHGRISHVIHLIEKDIVAKTKWLGELKANCRKTVKPFKKNLLLWTELRRLQRLEGKNALVMAADTRWSTIEKCFASVLESESTLLSMVSGREFLNSRELTFVRDKRVSVQEFWGGLQVFPLLQKVATRVFASASSSAADERNVLTHKFIHYSVRNAVKEGSVEKLIFIFFNAKSIGAEDIAVFDAFENLAGATSDKETGNHDSAFEYY
ncbi:hypothetical protein PI124_g4697 [Phytophthora idaei]|nr:hypothetical protein PI125_g4360 [Phytophthora idaei]KAG3170021.1 hypothetical protein PI126_g2549 [Phytophthora idaei]KAG3250656.1 hypothetical protein PI124_g4697 [Phytophthora idaei]